MLQESSLGNNNYDSDQEIDGDDDNCDVVKYLGMS